MRGPIDADLGGQIIKQRVARPGQGRRGGFRRLLGFGTDRAVFLFGFAKNERENIDSDQLATCATSSLRGWRPINRKLSKRSRMEI
jgi:hypothetical protein